MDVLVNSAPAAQLQPPRQTSVRLPRRIRFQLLFMASTNRRFGACYNSSDDENLANSSIVVPAVRDEAKQCAHRQLRSISETPNCSKGGHANSAFLIRGWTRRRRTTNAAYCCSQGLTVWENLRSHGGWFAVSRRTILSGLGAGQQSIFLTPQPAIRSGLSCRSAYSSERRSRTSLSRSLT